MADFLTDVRTINGIGELRAKALGKLGICTLRDLVSYFPRRYEDRSVFLPIRALVPGENACISAIVAAPPVLSRIRKGLELVKLTVADESGTLEITFFNQSYLKNSLREGETYTFYGKPEGSSLRRQMNNPIVEKPGISLLTGRIVPIYPLTAGVSSALLSRSIAQGLAACRSLLRDDLPEEIRAAHALCHSGFAYDNIHFPKDGEALSIARRRLVFEELFFLTLGLRRLRKRRELVAVTPCPDIAMEPFYAALPFALTGAQRRAIREAIADMQSARAMNRLCQGDVGSGKTMVAAACIYFMVRCGRQAALMAPTEILAQQHYAGLAPLLEPLGIHCALLTAATPAKEKRRLGAALADGSLDLAIGTHALFTDTVSYRDLGLVVTDEQHRFGVAQRAALSAKGKNPHLLVMSATPIPRTLALIIYGDLDVSVLDELPPGRQAIDTVAVGTSYRPRIYAFLRKLVGEGRQIFIVCPMVREDEDAPDERKAVTEYTKKLQEEIFPELRVCSIHGKMKAAEKERIMTAFSRGESDILVSTTVIEVGVDIPNAACMVVENAERFGLSQLHQLRGRVGRGKHQSYCVLISDPKTEETRARLAVMVKTRDGFKIAEEDLRLRGPGDFFGQKQHGLPTLKIADLSCDTALLKEAQTAALELLERDPDLTAHPACAERIREMFQSSADALN